MEQIYKKLISLSVQKKLSESDAEQVGVLFNKLFDFPKSQEREDCFFVIKRRLWNMEIA